MGKCYLISFVSPDLIQAAQRFEEQARITNWFDDIFIFGFDERLAHYEANCIKEKFNIENIRGYGLWAWKPDIINHFVNHYCEPEDVVLYLDIGFEFNHLGSKYFNNILLKAKKNYFVVTQTKKFEFLYSNRLLLNCFSSNILFFMTYQIQAGMMLFKCSDENLLTLSKWKSIVEFNNYEVLKSKGLLEPFIGENRHDQSVFSLLIKGNRKKSIINNPLAFDLRLLSICNYLQIFPFYSMRNYSNNLKIDNTNFLPNTNLISIMRYFFYRVMFKLK